MAKRKPLPRNAKIILADLARARRPLSVRKIAERNKIAWKTASDNIGRLERRGLAICKVGASKKGKRSCSITTKARKELETD